MEQESLKDFYRRFVAALVSEEGRATIERYFAKDAVLHGYPNLNVAGFQAVGAELQTAFSDVQVEVEDILADADRVVGRLTWQGVHSGPFLGAPATNRRFRAQEIEIARVIDGRIVELWGVFDLFAVQSQLGLTPT